MVPDTDDDSGGGDGPRGRGPDGRADTDDGGRTVDAGSVVDESPAVGSNWWYWVAAVPLYWVVTTVAGFALALVAFTLALTGAGVGAGVGAGLGLAGLALAAAGTLLALAGVVVSLAFPVAVYLDAEAVTAVRGDWRPDPALYGLLGLVGVLAQPLQVPLAVYYLYKRHESVGRP